MAYNGVFPATYQPMGYVPQAQPQMQQVQPVPPQTQMAQQNGQMTWVQGETGAKSYLLAPNTTLPLWDSERQTIYLKSADASGMPSMKILDYTIRDNAPAQSPIPMTTENTEHDFSNFVTKEEFKKFEQNITSEIKELKEDSGA